ncbi:MAG: DNA starvation/stationary phase protection protein [Gemmataceae bacterium]|nr:DNA starvation/stationary phase protection protein [Gemmataceae bacterium]
MADKSTNVIAFLNGLLADASVLARKLKHYHWNVRGRDFFTLHAAFEQMYTKWSGWYDALAERIVALGGRPLPTLKAELESTTLQEDSSYPDAATMVQRLLVDLEGVVQCVARAQTGSEQVGDRTTVNLLDEIADGIADASWKLKAYHA